MKNLIEWHKNKLNDIANRLNLSPYQIYWISAAKGVVIGYIIGANT